MNPLAAFAIDSAFTALFLLILALSRRDVDEEAGVHRGPLDREDVLAQPGHRTCPHCHGLLNSK